MANKENTRICFKCGRSPTADNVRLFRFPKPAVRNILRCTLWAKYLFPLEQQYCSIEFQTKLHSEHRMLCQKHFRNEDFTDATKTKLLTTAVPCEIKHVVAIPTVVLEPQTGLSIVNPEPQAGPSIVNPEIQPGPSILNREARAGPSLLNPEPQASPSFFNPEPQAQLRTPLREIQNKQELKGCTKPKYIEKLTTKKEKHLFVQCRKYMRDVCQLRNRIKKLKAKTILNTLTDEKCVKKLEEKITPTFSLLLQSQIKNFRRKPTGRRWSKEEKITALRLFKRSPTCYRLLRRMFELPAPGTLKVFLNRVPFCVGIIKPIFRVLAQFTKTQKPSDNEYILMFDEMSLKKHLNYNPKTELIEGYQDHGNQGRSQAIAGYALVFMIAGIRKRVKQPIAYYFSSGFVTADRLAVLIKEVLHQCFEDGVNISATVCDMDGVNRRALSILGASVQHPYITIENKEIVSIFDTPHLLKCFRNLFLKYDIQCTTNISSENKSGTGVAKWSHIKEFYDIDSCNPNYVFAPALTNEHLNPNNKQKMKVKLAAQVFSHCVAGGLYANVSMGLLTADAAVTANVVSNIDKLFDCLNSDTADRRRGKEYATNMTLKGPHLKFFKEMKKFFTTMKFIGCPRPPPSQEGWVWTINAVEHLFNQLIKTHKIKSLATRRLQQDPLENLFGCIRGNCGSNTNPTTGQFVAGLKTTILSGLAHIGTTGNCETDNNVIINNFDKLLSVSQSTHMQTEAKFLAINELSYESGIAQHIEEDSGEIQACAYVCGFIIKRLPNNCNTCKNIFISSNVEKYHLFVECREYSDFKKSLNYATKNMIACVETCATIINNYLKENGHCTSLKKSIITKITNTVNFDFLQECSMHRGQNIDSIVNNVFIICIRRFCIVTNRLFAQEASTSALKRKMNIILHK